jgi:putative Mn2+ efflux pump MntP
MSNVAILLIAIGLAMDAFAVSITSGITIKQLRVKHAMLIAGFFGVFQAIMPLLGWWGAHGVKEYICFVDHWIAFLLLTFVGGKMIYAACKNSSGEDVKSPLSIDVLFLLSIATSIDALAIGVTLSFIDVAILFPVLVIGVVTFIMSFLGTYIGNMFGHIFERKLEIIGGLVLIGIGLKILIEHLFFA